MKSPALWLLSITLWAISMPLSAAWSGIALSLEDEQSNWSFQSGDFSVVNRNGSLSVEDKTTSDLRVGLRIGEQSLRLDNASQLPSQKYSVSLLGLYFRLPIELSDQFEIRSRFSYQMHIGDSKNNDESEIEWYRARLTLGLGWKTHNIRLMPFVQWQALDGDISTSSSSLNFDQASQASGGLILDYFTHSTAYIRLQATAGDNQRLFISLVRELR